MADFNIPFSTDGDKRYPSSNEKSLGFPCGPADQELFNGLMHRLEAEVGEVIVFAGISPTDDRMTQLREAIEALINAATGGGDTSQFLLVSQARARLPIFPEFLTPDGKINCTSPATGTVRIPSGITFLHRGIYPIVTDETDFTTEANKIYHIRWNPSDGYEMKDLVLPAYNPSSHAENHTDFDTTYDDMLIARVVTNSSNVATITGLVNSNRLYFNEYRATSTGSVIGTDYTVSFDNQLFTWDFCRSPRFRSMHLVVGAQSTLSGTLDGNANWTVINQLDRYGMDVTISSDYSNPDTNNHFLSGNVSVGD